MLNGVTRHCTPYYEKTNGWALVFRFTPLRSIILSMNLLATPVGRRILFAACYLSEGAPIGFLWLALPTRLRASGVPIEQITWLTAVLVLPWTFKFVWAPLVDILRTRRWALQHWVVSAQLCMGLTLVPLLWLDLKADFNLIVGLLLLHAFSAATQDVAIDALCISVTNPLERGRLNGWMQGGMLLGRAMMGGGALVIGTYLGDRFVVVLLILVTTFSGLLVITSIRGNTPIAMPGIRSRARDVWRAALLALLRRNTWIGLAFALVGGAAFKSLEVVLGPFLVDRGYEKETIGWFSAGPMIVLMIVGSLTGGWLADRFGHRRFVAASLLFFVASISTLAFSDHWLGGKGGTHLLVLLAMTSFGIGLFTAASYAMFMDITIPALAATQFSAFMGATNGCESWSSYTVGRLVAWEGYPLGLLAMCAASLLGLPILMAMGKPQQAKTQEEIE